MKWPAKHTYPQGPEQYAPVTSVIDQEIAKVVPYRWHRQLLMVPTISDLDRLIGLEEFLREDVEKGRVQIVFNWSEVNKDGKVVTRTEYARRASSDIED